MFQLIPEKWFTIINFVFLAIGSVGLFILMTEPNYADIQTFQNLWIACIILFIGNALGKKSENFKWVARTIFAFVVLANAERAICQTYLYMQWSSNEPYVVQFPNSVNRRNAIRSGAIAVLVETFGMYLVAFLSTFRKRLQETLFGRIRMILHIAAIVLLVAGECIAWSVSRSCAPKGFDLGNTVPLLTAIIMVSGLLGDNESYDITAILAVIGFNDTVPIVLANMPNPYQTHIDRYATAYKATCFVGYALYIIGYLLAAVPTGTANFHRKFQSVKEKVMNKCFIFHVILVGMAIAGSICIYAKANFNSSQTEIAEKTRVFYATMAVVVSLMCIVGRFLPWESFHLLSAGIAFTMASGICKDLIEKDWTGQYVYGGVVRAGLLLCLTSLCAAPLAPHIFGVAEFKKLEEYFKGLKGTLLAVAFGMMYFFPQRYNVATDFIVWGFTATAIILATLAEDLDLLRLIYFALVYTACNRNDLWPFNAVSPTIDTFVLFCCCAWYALLYSVQEPKPFVLLHPELSEEKKAETEKLVETVDERPSTGYHTI